MMHGQDDRGGGGYQQWDNHEEEHHHQGDQQEAKEFDYVHPDFRHSAGGRGRGGATGRGRGGGRAVDYQQQLEDNRDDQTQGGDNVVKADGYNQSRPLFPFRLSHRGGLGGDPQQLEPNRDDQSHQEVQAHGNHVQPRGRGGGRGGGARQQQPADDTRNNQTDGAGEHRAQPTFGLSRGGRGGGRGGGRFQRGGSNMPSRFGLSGGNVTPLNEEPPSYASLHPRRASFHYPAQHQEFRFDDHEAQRRRRDEQERRSIVEKYHSPYDSSEFPNVPQTEGALGRSFGRGGRTRMGAYQFVGARGSAPGERSPSYLVPSSSTYRAPPPALHEQEADYNQQQLLPPPPPRSRHLSGNVSMQGQQQQVGGVNMAEFFDTMAQMFARAANDARVRVRHNGSQDW